MEHLWSKFQLAAVVTITGILYLAQVTSSINEFRRCYNTTDDMHCFDAQYDTTNNRWLTASFDNARQRCNSFNSTLIIIRDQEINDIVLNYISDPASPIRFQTVWTDAYRISDYTNTYTWHWVNSSLANLPASGVADTRDASWYAAALEFKSQFHLTAQQPHFSNSYVCEFEASRCPSTGSNVRQFADRCYVAVNASVSYYEARNRCLKDSGDLASFSNVASINFTTWLVADSSVRYWIGLRNTWYIWKDSGLEVKFSKWILDKVTGASWSTLCLVTCTNCAEGVTWLPRDCNTTESNYVICHSVTTLRSLTTSTSTTLSTFTSVEFETSPNNSFYQSESSDSTFSNRLSIGIGVGLGIGIPIIIAVIVIIIYVFARAGKSAEPKAPRDNSGLSTIREPTVAQQNNSANDHYQQLNRNQDNSSEAEYAQLGAQSERNLQENPSNGTLANNNELYEIVDNNL